uniref:Uncharacterized protein n=1 Tax=Arion vulgaris TaxID=1028688 RepID=A0A0B6XWW2_9EUPU
MFVVDRKTTENSVLQCYAKYNYIVAELKGKSPSIAGSVTNKKKNLFLKLLVNLTSYHITMATLKRHYTQTNRI